MRYLKSVVIIFSFLILFLGGWFISPILAGNAPAQSNSSLSANSAVPADGQTQATITVILHDTNNNPIVGDSVTISDPNNSSSVITVNSGTTDVVGRAFFSIKSTNTGTDSLNVTDTTTNTSFTGLGQVTFTTPTPTPVGQCGDSAPGSTPQITSVTPAGSSQIVLNWTDALNPVSNYLLAFGTSPGNYIYGSTNIGGQGTATYTVGYLTTGTKYYFAIKAVNGCHPGSFSNEVSATAGVANTPTPGPTSSTTSTTTTTVSTDSLTPANTSSDMGSQTAGNSTDTSTTASNTTTPTDTPAIAPNAPTGPSSGAVIEYVVICALALGIFGGVLYWSYMNDLKKSAKPIGETPVVKEDVMKEEVKPIQSATKEVK